MNERELAERCAVLGAETRVRVLARLRDKALACGDPAACDLSERCCSVGELARALALSVPTVSHHLKELRRAGMIRMERRGRFIYCSIRPEPMRQLAGFFGRIADDCRTDAGRADTRGARP